MIVKPGRKPKPTLVKLLEGNPGKRELNLNEPICELPARKPAFVAADKIASAEWNKLIGAMPPGLFTALDVSVLTMHVLASAMMQRAQQSIDKYGVTLKVEEVDNATGEVTLLKHEANPAVRVWKTAADTLIKTSDRLGLHPGARSRLNVPGKGEAPSSRFDGLLGALHRSN